MTQQQFYEISNKAISNFHGNGRVLESALGALMVGQFIGWRPLLLMHGGSAIKRYQTILELIFSRYFQKKRNFQNACRDISLRERWASIGIPFAALLQVALLKLFCQM